MGVWSNASVLPEKLVSKVTKAFRVSVPERKQRLHFSLKWTLPEAQACKRDLGNLRDLPRYDFRTLVVQKHAFYQVKGWMVLWRVWRPL